MVICPHCKGKVFDNGEGDCTLCGRPLKAIPPLDGKPTKRKYTKRIPETEDGRKGKLSDRDELMRLRGWQEAAREFLKAVAE